MAIGSILTLAPFSATPSPPPTGFLEMYVQGTTIYLQDAMGNIYAFGSTTAITQLTGDVSAIGPGSAVATVNFVGGSSAASVAAAAVAVAAATSSNTPSTLVERDSSGNFSAGTITANLTGTATNATTAVNFSGSLSGDVTGTQSATTIADTVVSGKLLTGYTTGTNTPILATDSILTAFENLQAQVSATSGSAITALTGDGTATGPGSAVLTVNSVNGKVPGAANGLATLDGSSFVTASQIPFGSTVNTVTQGNDNRLSVQNVVRVKKNPGAGEFSSVVTALASITTASAINPFVISVGPGIYVESQIVMKNYVGIEGEQPFSTILVASNPAQPFILGADSSGLTRLGIQGATGSGGIGVYYTSNAAATPRFNMLQCVFGNNTTLIQADGNGGNVVNMTLSQCAASGTNPFTTGILVTNDVVNTAVNLSVSGFSIQAAGATAPTDFVKASGINTSIILSSVILQSVSGGNGIHVFNGTTLVTNGCSLSGLTQGLYVPNSGANCALLAESLQVNNSVTADVNIVQTGATGSVSGAFKTANSTISAANLSVFTTDPTDGITLTNTFTFGPNFADRTDITNLILGVPAMGLLSGGILSSGGGLLVDVSAGTGYITLGSYDSYITWGSSSITLTATSVNYLYFNSSSTLTASPSFPNTTSNILLGRVITNATGIEFIDASPMNTSHYGNLNDNFVREALGPVFSFGCLVTEDVTPLELDVSGGSYYFGDNNFLPSAGTAITFQTFYQNGSGGWIIGSSTTVDTNNYDNGSGILQPIPTNDYVRHTLYLVGQGSNQEYLFVYGQTVYTSLVLAQTGNIPSPPSYFIDGVVLLASIIVKQGSTSIVSGGGQIVDNRPRIGFSTPAVQAVGTVTSVALALPASVFSVSGSPVTTTGTLTGSFNTQAANLVFAGPGSGSAAVPTFRSLVAADIPNLVGDVTGNIGANTVVAIQGSSVSNTAPTDAQILIWASGTSKWTPTSISGDILIADTGAATIQANVVSNSKLAQAPANTLKGNNTGVTANVTDLTVSQVNTMLGTVTTIGTIDTNANSNGLFISGNTLSTQSASASNPGMVNNTTQSFSGNKTFTGTVAITPASISALTINTASFIFDTVNNALGIGLQPATSVMIDGINTSGASKLVQMTGYGTGSTVGYRGRFARGTLGSPSAVQAGDNLSAISARGYGTSQFAAASTGVINIVAGETFTNSSNLTYLQFSTTPTGSVTSAEAMRVASTGVTLGPQSSSTAIHQINGGVNVTTKTITASTYTVDTTTTDNIIYTDSTSNAITITLPTATNGRLLLIQDKTGQASTNHITITPPGSVTINGVNASVLLGVNYGGWAFTSDGTNWTAFRLAQLPSVQAISGTVIDWSTVGAAGGVFTKTLSANTTFTFSNATAGQTIVIRLTNTASNYTVTWGTTVKWPVQTSPVMTTGAFSDVYTIVYDGTNYYGGYLQNF